MVRDLEQIHDRTCKSLLVKWLEMFSAHGWVLPVLQGTQNSNEQTRLKTGKTYLLYRLVNGLRDSYFKDNLCWNSLLEAAKSKTSKSGTRGTQNRTVSLNSRLQYSSVDSFQISLTKCQEEK
jgi:hypothetical protein